MKTKKERIPLGVKNEFDDIDYWTTLRKSKETVTLDNGEVISVYDYMKKFMQESYGNGFSRKDPDSNILKTNEQKSWAIRNNNNTNRDALLVAGKTNGLINLDYLLTYNDNQDEPWEHTLKIGNYEQALDHLLSISADEIGCDLSDETKRGLLRYYFRIKKLLRYIRKDNKNEK